jgi:hypothetical protein
MYGASDFCDGQCWCWCWWGWGWGWESATPGCPAEIEWWFPECAQHIFNKVGEGDRGNHMEELSLFPAQDTT